MTIFLLLTLAIRVVLIITGFAICYYLFVRSMRNGPVHHAFVDYFVANTFAMTWYILANAELWFFQSNLMQTFGLIVWVPLLWATGRLWWVLRQS